MLTPASRRARRAAIAVLALACAALVFWWMREPAAPQVPAGAAPAARLPAAAAPASGPAVAASRRVELRLLPEAGALPRLDGIRLGLAYVAPEQARRWQDWVAGGQQGAGPASFAELAEVREWRPLPGRREPDGSVRVTLPLAAADRYDLQARGEDELGYYAASFTAAAVPAELRPLHAAGLRLRGAAPGARLLLRRSADNASAPPWPALLAHAAPSLLAAFDDTPLPVADGELLAPLPPGPLELQVQVEGIAAERHALTLRGGEVSEVRLDATAQAVAAAVSIELQLQLVETPGELPLAEVLVTWHDEERDHQRRSDAAGLVSFARVDRQRLQRFTLTLPRDGDLPRWPETQAIELDPEAGVALAGGRVRRQRVALAPLDWLEVDAGAPLEPLQRAGRDPYPVFVLQRAGNDGAWRDVAADHFLARPHGLAVSLAAPGSYRLLAVESPWRVRVSESVDTRERRGPHRVPLHVAPGHRVALELRHAGQALAGAPVHLVGPATRLPPRVLAADADGRIVLEHVTEAQVMLEVPGYAAQRVDLRGTSVSVELTPEEVSIPRQSRGL